jgi:hypothetical protein
MRMAVTPKKRAAASARGSTRTAGATLGAMLLLCASPSPERTRLVACWRTLLLIPLLPVKLKRPWAPFCLKWAVDNGPKENGATQSSPTNSWETRHLPCTVINADEFLQAKFM